MRVTISREKIVEASKKKERVKGHVTLYLDRDRFKLFKEMCAKFGISTNRAIDELIKAFLESKK